MFRSKTHLIHYLFYGLIAMFSIGQKESFAAHVYGGELTYTSLGNDQYRIRAIVYYDCNGTDESNANIWAYSIVDGSPRLITANQTYSGFVSNAYPFNPCYQAPAGVCLKKEIYEATTTLESGLGGFSLHMEVFNRAATVGNLTNPDNYGAIFYCTVPDPLDAVAGGSHNAPQFALDPPPNLCLHDTIRYDHSVIEPDGDSIVYKFCNPRGRFGVAGAGPEFIPRPYPNVPWCCGYNTNDQLPAANPFTIDPNTGLLVGVPNQVGVYVYAVCYEEYRNGVLINEGNRDYMFTITNCPAIPTSADFVSQTQDTSMGYCGSLNVQFTDLSTNATRWKWDFGDGNFSNLQNPYHSYLNPGDYWVTLTVNQGLDCEQSITRLFEVYPKVDTVQINNLLAQCFEGNAFDFSFSGPYNTYNDVLWDFGPWAIPNSSSEVSPQGVGFTQSGLHEVVLTISNKTCLYRDTIQVLVKPNPSSLFIAPDSICISDTLQLSSSSTFDVGGNHNWSAESVSYEAGMTTTDYSVLFASSGWKTLELVTEENGCSDSLLDSIFVQALPNGIIAHGQAIKQCLNSNNFYFNAQGSFPSNSVFCWKFPSGSTFNDSSNQNVQVSFPDTGWHVFDLEVEAGPCRLLLTDSIYLGPNPESNFSFDQLACFESDTLDFIFTGTVNEDANFQWNFGPSNRYEILSSSSLSDSNMYSIRLTDTGWYPIRLITQEYGCRDSLIDSIYVHPKLTAGFLAPWAQCITNNSFDFEASGNFQGTAGFNWIFGPASPSNETIQNPTNIVFSDTGLLPVILEVEENNCWAKDTQRVHVTAFPSAEIDYSGDTCVNYPIHLAATGSWSDSVQFEWELPELFFHPEGWESSDSMIPNLYGPDTGSYVVYLYISDNGCTDTIEQTIRYNSIPEAHFDSLNPGCLSNHSYNLVNRGDKNMQARWDISPNSLGPFFGDSIGNVQFPDTGWYQVSLSVSQQGCADTMQRWVYIAPDPEVNFSPLDTQCLSVGITQIQAQGIFPDTARIFWDFGAQANPSNSNQRDVDVDFTALGWHRIEVRVEAFGCSNTFIDSVYVSEDPVASFTAPGPQCLSSNSFNFNSTSSFTGDASFIWLFENGSPSISSNPNPTGIRFNQEGYNTVELHVLNHGCESIFLDSIFVTPGPVPSIEPVGPQCVNGNLFQFDASNSSYTNNTSFVWDFGSNASIQTFNGLTPPPVSFDTTGTFTVTLTMNEDTCTGSSSIQVEVISPPHASFISSSADTQCVNGNRYDFINTSSFSDSAYFDWTFTSTSQPSQSSSRNASNIVWQDTGLKIIQLLVSDLGCQDILQDSIYIHPAPIPEIIPVDSQCVEANRYGFSADPSTYHSSAIFSWDFGLDATPNNATGRKIFPVSFSDTGWHEVVLELRQWGCSVNDTTSFFIGSAPENAIAVNDPIQCIEGQIFNFYANGNYDPQSSLRWYFIGANLDSAYGDSVLNVSFDSTGTHPVLLVTQSFECLDSVWTTIEVIERPEVFFAQPDSQCFESQNHFLIMNRSVDSDLSYWVLEGANTDTVYGDTLSGVWFNDTGHYDVLACVRREDCDSCHLDSVYIFPSPIPYFDALEAQCFNAQNIFIIASGNYGSSSQRFWTFENASRDSIFGDTAQGVEFLSPGWNSLEFWVVEGYCKRSYTDSIFLFDPPVAGILPIDSQCVDGNSYQFDGYQNSQFYNEGSWIWSFPGASPASSSDSIVNGVNYFSDGTFPAQLVVEEKGCFDTLNFDVYVAPPPQANFDLMAGVSDTQCISINQYDFEGLDQPYEPGALFTWDFGSNGTGSSLTDQALGIVFQDTGWQEVQFKVQEYQCVDSSSLSVFVSPLPEPWISSQDTQCLGNQNFVFLADSSTYLSGASFNWDFGPNGNPSNSSGIKSDSIRFSQSGWHRYSLTISQFGCDSVIWDSVYVQDNPIANFDIDAVNQCISENNFRVWASDTQALSSSAEYYFYSKNDTVFRGSGSFSFSDTGTYRIHFYVEDQGCYDSSSVLVQLYPETEANFSFDPAAGCQPLEVQFSNESFSYRPLSFSWWFGDGNSSQAENPTHTYQDTGLYSVRLIAVADSFCTKPDTLLVPNAIEVQADPVSSFTVEPYETSIFTPYVAFFNTSNDTGSSWFYTDMMSYFGDSVEHVYQDTGWHEVIQVLISPLGCKDSSAQWLYIRPEFEFYSPNAFSPNKDGLNENFIQKGMGIRNYRLTIYNRWGEKIFRTDDQSRGWNGWDERNSQPAPMGSYAWKTEVEDVFGKVWNYQGRVVLLR